MTRLGSKGKGGRGRGDKQKQRKEEIEIAGKGKGRRRRVRAEELLEVDELDVEEEGGVGRDHTRHSTCSIPRKKDSMLHSTNC